MCLICFLRAIWQAIDKARPLRSPDFAVPNTYTARFFSVPFEDNCDRVSRMCLRTGRGLFSARI